MSYPQHPKSDEHPHAYQPPPAVGPVTTANAPVLGSGPTTVLCPSCHATIQTRVQYETSTKTHMMALILCLVGCWPCAVIPYYKDSCKNAAHHCPDCGAYLGVYIH